TTVKTMLLMRRDEDRSHIRPVLRSGTEEISHSPRGGGCAGASPEDGRVAGEKAERSGAPSVDDVKPWRLRRRSMAQRVAANMARDASAALKPSGEQRLP